MNLNVTCRLKNSVWSLLNWKLRELSIPQTQRTFIRTSSDHPGVPKNVVGNIYTATYQPENGAIYERKPFKMRLYPNKKYMWCLCGYSKSQPICDGSHLRPNLKIKLKPIRFQVELEGDYYICNCKHTKHRPFCDGTHKEI